MPPQVGVGVAALIFNENGNLLLLKRKGSHGEGKWSCPGGWIENGEFGGEAVVREVKEETGLDVTVQFDTEYTEDIHPEGVHDVCLWYWCKMDNSSQSPSIKEPEKASDMGWFSVEQIHEMYDDLFLPLKIYSDLDYLKEAFRDYANDH